MHLYFSAKYLHICQFTASKSGSSSGLPIPIIAGVGGGAILFVLIIICFVVCCCVKRSKRNKDYPVKSVYSNSKAVSDFYIGLKRVCRTEAFYIHSIMFR